METNFNPDINNSEGIFGLPFKEEESKIVIIPVPWELTTSYGKGTHLGPKSIFEASFQLDLYQQYFPDFWKCGIFIQKENEKLRKRGLELENSAKELSEFFNNSTKLTESDLRKLDEINTACLEMNTYVYQQSRKIIEQESIPIVLGGDHSTPLGLIKALSEEHRNFGILHIDAHADLRRAYQGFKFSHASIMYNAKKLESVGRIVQLFVRDYCQEEENIIRTETNKITCFTDRYIKNSLFEDRKWSSIVWEIIELLPSKVYISFDIDGLDPSLCPNTGTPVPGGANFEMISYLFECIIESGRRIIGADLCEVSPSKNDNNEWDANVGARALMQLCLSISASNRFN